MQNVNILTLLVAILGFVVSFLLIFSRGQNQFVNRFLGITFWVVAFRSLSVFAVNEDYSNNNYFVGYASCFFYIIPPGFYLYFRSIILDEQSLRKNDYRHFLMPVLAFCLLFFYVIRTLIVKGNLDIPDNQIIDNTVVEFPGHIIPKYHLYALCLLCAFYVVKSWLLVFFKLKKKNHEHIQIKKVRTWIYTLLITCTLLMLVLFYNAALVLLIKKEISQYYKPDNIRSFILTLLFTRVLFKPDLLYGIPQMETNLPEIDLIPGNAIVPSLNVENENPKENSLDDNSNDRKSDDDLYFDKNGWIDTNRLHAFVKLQMADVVSIPIEEDKVIAYINKINEYIETEPFKNQDFDMKTIASELNIPLYHIEYIFRYYNRFSFPEFRNFLRVRYVLDVLKLGIPKNYTMEAIGAQAGFSSRSSFFRVFKQVSGKTPKQYLE